MIARVMPLVSVVTLAAWLGAAVLVAAVVAPAAFAALPSRALAGAVVGRVLPVIFWSGMLVGVGATLALRPFRARPGLGVTSLGVALACAVAQIGVAPRIAALRATGAIDALDPSDPRRIAFGRLHAASVACMGVAALCAGVALVLLVRSLSVRSTP